MSRKFQEKDKDLSKLKVVTSDKVWDLKKKRKGKPTLSKKYSIYGKVEVGTSAFVTTTNSIGENNKFIENTSCLPKKIKNDIVDLFKNKKKKVVYLVKS